MNLKMIKILYQKLFKKNSFALKYASNELRNNKDIILQAVKNDCGAIRHASEELRNDKDIVLQAVKNDGYVVCI